VTLDPIAVRYKQPSRPQNGSSISGNGLCLERQEHRPETATPKNHLFDNSLEVIATIGVPDGI
jgi:hypothetical protein